MTMNNETPPLDLAHLKAQLSDFRDRILESRSRWSSEHGLLADLHEWLDNAFPQLCRELEVEKLSAEFACNEVSIRNQTIDSLQSQLSKAEGERDRMRDALKSLAEDAQNRADDYPEDHPVHRSITRAFKLLQPIPQTEGREVVKPTVTQEEYLLQLFTNWCECSPYGEQIPDKWPELMADFVKKHKGKDRDAMAELFAEGDPGEPFEKLLESIFVTSCQFVLSDLSQAVDDGDTIKMAIIGLPAPVSEKGGEK